MMPPRSLFSLYSLVLSHQVITPHQPTLEGTVEQVSDILQDAVLPPNTGDSLRRAGVSAVTGNEVYHFAIVDFLQLFNIGRAGSKTRVVAH